MVLLPPENEPMLKLSSKYNKGVEIKCQNGTQTYLNSVDSVLRVSGRDTELYLKGL